MSETVLALTHALSMPHARRNLDDFLETALIQKWSPTQVLEAFLTTEADGRAAIGLKRRLGILGILWCVKVFGQFGYATWVTCVVCCSHACAGVWYPSAEWGRIRL